MAAAALACACMALTACRSSAGDSLQGTWSMQGSLVVGGAPQQGSGTLKVMPDRRFVWVFQGPKTFNLAQGEARVGSGKLDLNPLGGAPMSGELARDGTGYRFTSWAGTLRLQPLANTPATLETAARVTGIAATPSISDWAARAALAAPLWAPDAALHSVSMLDITPGGHLGPKTSIDVRFYSPSRRQMLLAARGPAGVLHTVVTDWQPSARDAAFIPIPMPILDAADVVRAARAQGRKVIYTSAQLETASGADKRPGVLWRMSIAGSGGFGRDCYSVSTQRFIDCTQYFGDPIAEFEALQRRAAAAWAAMQSRWSQGDGSATSLSGQPFDAGADQAARDQQRRYESQLKAMGSGDWGAAARIGDGHCMSGDATRYGC